MILAKTQKATLTHNESPCRLLRLAIADSAGIVSRVGYPRNLFAVKPPTWRLLTRSRYAEEKLMRVVRP